MTAMPESVPIQTPLIGLTMDPETATYVGMLEGTIAALVINETKYRALLEMLTGDSWEATRVDMDGNVLMGLAVSALVKQTGMDLTRAKVLVLQRWSERNLPADAIVPVAVSPAELTKSVTGDQLPTAPSSTQTSAPMTERAKAWREAQIASAARLSEADLKPETPVAQSDSESGTTVPVESGSGTSVPQK